MTGLQVLAVLLGLSIFINCSGALNCYSCRACTPKQAELICQARGGCRCPPDADVCMTRRDDFRMAGGVAFRSCASRASTGKLAQLPISTNNTQQPTGSPPKSALNLGCTRFPGVEGMPGRVVITCACSTDYCNNGDGGYSAAGSSRGISSTLLVVGVGILAMTQLFGAI